MTNLFLRLTGTNIQEHPGVAGTGGIAERSGASSSQIDHDHARGSGGTKIPLA
jgi:hypothetical protein